MKPRRERRLSDIEIEGANGSNGSTLADHRSRMRSFDLGFTANVSYAVPVATRSLGHFRTLTPIARALPIHRSGVPKAHPERRSNNAPD